MFVSCLPCRACAGHELPMSAYTQLRLLEHGHKLLEPGKAFCGSFVMQENRVSLQT